MNRLIPVFLAIHFLQACSEDPKNLTISRPGISNAVKKRKAQYFNEVLSNCRRDILIKADAYVDSVISAEINFQLSDSVYFPDRPARPEWLGPIIVSDTIRAKPVFPLK
jgi:hypothetical protein